MRVVQREFALRQLTSASEIRRTWLDIVCGSGKVRQVDQLRCSELHHGPSPNVGRRLGLDAAPI